MASNLKSGIARFGDFDTYFMPTYELIDDNLGGTLYTWGYNYNGVLGINGSTPFSVSSPVQVYSANSNVWKSVAASAINHYALTVNGDLYGWGQSETIGISDGATSNYRSSPVQITGSSSNIWVSIQPGRALKADGTLWCWGRNGYGQVGDNTIIPRSSPVQVVHPNGSKWAKLSKAECTASAGSLSVPGNTGHIIDEFGNLWVLGTNYNGGHGNNSSTTINASTPIQIGSSKWLQVSSSEQNTGAIRSDNTLWVWGYNANGNVGDGTVIHRSSPVQIGTSANWKQIFVGWGTSYAIKNDGTLWSWGMNNYGALGINAPTTARYSSPVQVGTSSDWKYVCSSGDFAVAAIKTDGTLWTWGNNSSGELGDNTIISKSSPVQVLAPNVKWRTIAVSSYNGYNHMIATTAGEGPAGLPTYHVTDTQSGAACYSAQGGFSLDIVQGQAIMYFGLWPSDPPNCQYCYGAWLAFASLGVDRTGANANSNGYRVTNNIRPYWSMGGAPLNLSAIPVGSTVYWQSSNWPYTLVSYTYKVTKTTSNSISIQTYPNAWGTGDTGTSITVSNWFARLNSFWGGVDGGKAGWTLGTGTFSW